jgi:hypothetical protein
MALHLPEKEQAIHNISQVMPSSSCEKKLNRPVNQYSIVILKKNLIRYSYIPDAYERILIQ